MFSQKRPVAFISDHFIDLGFVVTGKPAVFEPGEAFSYTKETFQDAIKRMAAFSKEGISIVLGEEFVYVTELSFPDESIITRELVLEQVEQSIPEDLHQTDWDFQTLHYAKKLKKSEQVRVQVVVLKKSFSDSFHQALQHTHLSVRNVLPESCALAGLEREETGVSVIVQQNRETVVLCAIEEGSVIATHIRKNTVTPDEVRTLLDFLVGHKGKKPEKIFFSHFEEAALEPFLDLSHLGYLVTEKEYNPLVSPALMEKTSGKDAEILNIDVFSSSTKKPWWQFF